MVNVFEWALAVFYDVAVMKMEVRCKEDHLLPSRLSIPTIFGLEGLPL
jgi:hypothetical protein